MRKLLLTLLFCAILSLSAAGQAGEASVARPAALPGTVAIDYTLIEDGSIWSHAYKIDKFDPGSGKFSGAGHFIPDPSYTETITGAVVGNFVTFHILYTGTNANYQVDAMGMLDDTGHLRGVAVSVGQSFTWGGTLDHTPDS